MEILRAIWPNQADINATMISPPRHALWEQRAIGAFVIVGSVALWASLAWRLAGFFLGHV